jgi:hypothetical protein
VEITPVALKSSKQLEAERRKASRVPPKLGASGNSGLQPPKSSPRRKRGLTIGLVAAGAMTIFGFSSIDRQPQQPCVPNPNGDQTCPPQGSGSSSSSGSRSFFSSWGSSSGSSSGSYWGGHSSGTSGVATALASRGGFGSTGSAHASSGG